MDEFVVCIRGMSDNELTTANFSGKPPQGVDEPVDLFIGETDSCFSIMSPISQL